jgi:hypothetical protein
VYPVELFRFNVDVGSNRLMQEAGSSMIAAVVLDTRISHRPWPETQVSVCLFAVVVRFLSDN